MMIVRFCFGLMAMAGAAGAGMAADVAPAPVPVQAPVREPNTLAPVPGAHVTIEGGVRVIRPASPVSGAHALEQADTHGSLIYHGAAFYRVPSAVLPKADDADESKSSATPSAR